MVFFINGKVKRGKLIFSIYFPLLLRTTRRQLENLSKDLTTGSYAWASGGEVSSQRINEYRNDYVKMRTLLVDEVEKSGLNYEDIIRSQA